MRTGPKYTFSGHPQSYRAHIGVIGHVCFNAPLPVGLESGPPVYVTTQIVCYTAAPLDSFAAWAPRQGNRNVPRRRRVTSPPVWWATRPGQPKEAFRVSGVTALVCCSCHVLYCLVMSYRVLSDFVLYCLDCQVKYCLVLYDLVVSYLALSCLAS